ncbi:hypothetical protein [Deinococcus roseus]|uniref:Uncharacterized protein n=1 Tax=Deinococcus roseus TaxID=392414 RepID=A0ABQ2CYJ2_9DEIO|nr:hypothetical protein [Deinococcus roseus]GGJ33417.1 hypothetical protein GCM10008938_19590 [Deinococcus roseus]
MPVQINDFQVVTGPAASQSGQGQTPHKTDTTKEVLKIVLKRESRKQRLKVDGGKP